MPLQEVVNEPALSSVAGPHGSMKHLGLPSNASTLHDPTISVIPKAYVVSSQQIASSNIGISSISSDGQRGVSEQPKTARRKDDILWEDVQPSLYFLYNGIYYIGMDIVFYPFDLLKTRLQVRPTKERPFDLFRMLRTIVSTEGYRGLYRGILPSILGSYPGQAIYYTSYEISKDKLYHRFKIDDHRGSRLFPLMEFAVTGLSGLTAELASALFFVPSDNVTQKLQVHSVEGMPKYHGVRDVLSTIVRYEGYLGLYRGYKATVLTYAPGSAVWWAAYEMGKDLVHSFFDKRSSLSHRIFGNHSNLMDSVVHMTSGAFAGFACCIVTNPLDVAKTRLQVLDARHEGQRAIIKQGLWPMLRGILRKDGLPGLYRGILARLIISVPGSALSFVTYEYVKKLSRSPTKAHET